MKKINLLPEKVQKAKDVRRITIILAAVQAAIFLAAVLLYVFFSMWEARLNIEAQNLASFLVENPVRQADSESFHFLMQDEFLTKDTLIFAQTAPVGVWLYALRFDHGEINITARTEDIMKIQAHIETLSEFFYGIRLTNLAATDDGDYIYDINFFQDKQYMR